MFDTAAMYSGGASERRLGELTHDKDVLIASKFPGSFNFRTENFPKELDASLRRLGRSSVDLYQHHFPSNRVSIPELMQLLADAVEAGKVKAVGVSNYSAEQMRIAHAALAKRGIPLASNQVEYSLLHRQPEVNGVLDACRELGITLIAYPPLAMGALTGKYSAKVKASGLRRFMPNLTRRRWRRCSRWWSYCARLARLLKDTRPGCRALADRKSGCAPYPWGEERQAGDG